MNTGLTPSTQWQENIAADETERFAEYGKAFVAIQERKSKKYGKGRALHRKQHTAAKGTLEVLGGLPEFARQGLFAMPGKFKVVMRLSNGGPDSAPDRAPDVRGIGLRVLGVKGDSALGNGAATSQDFTLINQEQFAFPKSDEFVAFVLAASNGGVALVKYLVKRYGLVGGPLRMLKMVELFPVTSCLKTTSYRWYIWRATSKTAETAQKAESLSLLTL